jgi:hypothetical protein
MIYRNKRDITSHTYDEAKAIEVAAVIPAFAEDAQDLLRGLGERGTTGDA